MWSGVISWSGLVCAQSMMTWCCWWAIWLLAKPKLHKSPPAWIEPINGPSGKSLLPTAQLLLVSLSWSRNQKSQFDSLFLSSLLVFLSRTFSSEMDSVSPWEIHVCSALQTPLLLIKISSAPPRWRCIFSSLLFPLKSLHRKAIYFSVSDDSYLRRDSITFPLEYPQVHLISSHHKRLGSSVKNIKWILWVCN